MKIAEISQYLTEIKVNDITFIIFGEGSEQEVGIQIQGNNDCISVWDLETVLQEAKKVLARS
jgi:VCBS repeat-containing protein